MKNTKMRALTARHTSVQAEKHTIKMCPQSRSMQSGVTLIELMVGLVIGLLVVAVAMAALMVSRGISGTVSDASQLQQQGAYAMRVIGGQLRQAGSLYLNPDPAQSGAASDPKQPVAFETNTQNNPDGNDFDQSNTLANSSTDTTLKTAFRRYKEAVFTSTADQALSRNCIGLPGNTSNDRSVDSTFTFQNNALVCGGNGQTAQPIISNVAEVQFTYLEQRAGAQGTTVLRNKAADVKNWRCVQGVEVCMVLYGTEPTDMPEGSSYTACAPDTAGKPVKVDMTTLTGERQRRMHLQLRNTFQLRSQGLLDPENSCTAS